MRWPASGALPRGASRIPWPDISRPKSLEGSLNANACLVTLHCKVNPRLRRTKNALVPKCNAIVAKIGLVVCRPGHHEPARVTNQSVLSKGSSRQLWQARVDSHPGAHKRGRQHTSGLDGRLLG